MKRIAETLAVVLLLFVAGNAIGQDPPPVVPATHVSGGQFGSATNGGFEYSFPGKVGVGTTAPKNPLNIVANAGGILNLQTTAGLRIDDSWSPSIAILLGVDSGTNAGVVQTVHPGVSWENRFLALQPNGGTVGIGTITPAATLHVFGRALSTNTVFKLENPLSAQAAFITAKSDTDRVFRYGIFGSSATGSTFGVTNANAAFIYTATEATNHPSALLIGTHGGAPIVFGTGGEERARINAAGDLTVVGNISAAKVINATFQDLAEWVPATTDMPPGTLVVLNPSKENEVMISGRAYDSTVAGVVSEQPGILLGIPGDSKEQIATTGRVRVRVDATSAPIRIGDLLVTSNKPGMAMRSQPIELHGRLMHQPGTIIGKALQPLERGEGEILVLLSMQ